MIIEVPFSNLPIYFINVFSIGAERFKVSTLQKLFVCFFV